jgi:hypothetical protein
MSARVMRSLYHGSRIGGSARIEAVAREFRWLDVATCRANGAGAPDPQHP